MSGQEDEADKEHEASQQKLDRARKDGDIPKSVDLQTAVATGGFLLALFTFGAWAVQRSGSAGMVLLDQADRLSSLVMAGGSGPVAGILLAVAGPPLALLVLAPVLVLTLLVATRGFVVAPSKLAPKLSRISPIATAGQKFGVDGLVEFAKSAVKLCFVSLILYYFLAARLEEILASLYLTPAMSGALMARMTLHFLAIVFVIQLVVGGVDFIWQNFQHRQRQRMSRKEMMDEYKESEGDPHLKAARRQRAQEVATNNMLSDVATANVVVVNPTHYAVALRWDRAKGGAPVCVAKGVDEIAHKIRERAAEHGVPIHSDPPTARAIHATVEVGQEIRVEQYRAVAAAIRFAETMRKRARRK
ncbi:flagellar biosynthesis protein FlhB [Tabrizicola sp.]|uniref:EscU/YscU/HrcU family type III secretion system export apparatus switch protein n=1 Tax=Tabrizicola sp. TaxID=2005166 RepID=UPI002734D201|nr:flagellar type III secretion system protein FlhB [Tabrizicola sp.]MDP3193993.1 flagellar type III secretion system protein FlhB [Tabrizicola sp.]